MALLQSVNGLQEQLQNYLGQEKYEWYLENIRDWFGERVTKDFFDFQMSLVLDENALIIHNEMMRMLIYCCDHTTSAVVPYQEERIGTATASDIAASCTLQDGQYVVNTNEFIASSMSQEDAFGNGESEYITVNFVDSEATNESMNYYHNRHAVRPIEEEIKPVSPSPPVDWMFNVEDVHPDTEEWDMIPSAPTDRRFPSNFAQEFLYGDNSKRHIIPNVSHGLDITDRLNKIPHLKKHFGNPITVKDKLVYLPVGSTLHGQFLLKAWEAGIESVDINATNLAIEAVKDHICSIVKALIKQRRAFRMRDNKISHSIGLPYPNPYLRQGQQLYDDPYSSDTAQLADAMQVPSLLSLSDEKERLAALQIAASVGSKPEYRFPATRVTSADLIDLLETNPTVIPQTSSRLKMQEIAQQNYKGYGGNFHSDDYNDDERSILPLCSY